MTNIRRLLSLSFAEKYFTLCAGVVSTVVLARLLGPEDIGLFSVASALINVAQMFRDFGVANFVLKEKDLSRDKLATALGICLISGLGFALVFALGSDLIARYYGDPRLKAVVMALALNFIIVALASVSTACLRRQMNFTAVMRAGMAQGAVNAGLSIALAWAGFGAMSMVWGALAGMAANLAVAQAHLGHHMLVRPGLKEWRRMVSFGAMSSAAHFLVGIGERLPDLVIGRMLGFAAVGFYSRGNSLVTLFNQSVVHAIWPVTISALAQRHRDNQDLRQPFLKSLALLTGVAWPLLGLLALHAGPIIHIVFGEQWLPAVPVSRVLCAAAAVAVVNHLSFSLISAVGNVRLHLKVQAVVVPLQVPLLVLAAGHGIIEVAAVALAVELAQIVLYGRPVLASLEIRWREAFGACRASLGVAAATLAPGLILVGLDGLSADLGWLELAAAMTAGGSVWLAALFLFRHPLRDEVVIVLRHLRAAVVRATV